MNIMILIFICLTHAINQPITAMQDKVDIELTCQEHNDLFFAALENCLFCCKQLLNKNTNPNLETDYFKGYTYCTPLHIAANQNFPKIAKFLLEHKALINKKNGDNETALHLAARKNSIETSELLLQNNGDINVKNKDGNTPMHVAAFENSYEIAKLILHYKPNPTIKNNRGNTSLHIAAANDLIDFTKLLLNCDMNAITIFLLCLKRMDKRIFPPKPILKIIIAYAFFHLHKATLAANTKNKKDLKPSQLTTDKKLKLILQQYETDK